MESISLFFIRLVLGAEGQETLALNRFEILWSSWCDWGTDDKLSLELPVLGDTPALVDLLVDEWIVMLKVGAQALELKCGPCGDLVHGVGLGGPA